MSEATPPSLFGTHYFSGDTAEEISTRTEDKSICRLGDSRRILFEEVYLEGH